jgi:hypothetical protein
VKIVYNACHGGFSLSDEAVMAYADRKGWTLFRETSQYGFDTYWRVPERLRTGIIPSEEWYSATEDAKEASNKRYSELVFEPRDIDRSDPDLVAVVEELGSLAGGRHANLRIADVPAGARYRIDEYDGYESVMTVDDYEWKIAV